LLRYLKPKFHRQKIIGNYIADFYCPKLKIIIEVDGSQHYEEKQLIYDAIRTEYLEEFGYEVIRIPNYIVNKEFNGLINYLLEYCREKCKDFDLEFIYNVERNWRTKFK
jgi:very-short-patch-repair endonuclease